MVQFSINAFYNAILSNILLTLNNFFYTNGVDKNVKSISRCWYKSMNQDVLLAPVLECI